MNAVKPSTHRPALEVGDRGFAVRAAQRAAAKYLREHDGASLNLQNGQFGDGLLRDVRVIQRVERVLVYTKRYPQGYATGKIGRRTWEVLEPYLDDFGHQLLRDDEAAVVADTLEAKTAKIRAALVSHAWDAINHPSRWAYAQVRPAPHVWPDAGEVCRTDCSGSVVLIREVSGARDPQGFGFDGRAFTGWLRAAGVRIADDQITTGDLLHYGDTEGAQHVTMALEPWRGPATTCFSFGSNPPSRRDADRPGYRPLDFATRHALL